MRNLLKATFLVVALVLVLIALYGGYVRFRSPAAAVSDFYDSSNRGEDQLADPLILTGCRAADLVIREIQNSNMRRRRYAISYLGNRRCSQAIETLRRILADEREIDYFRGDALEAIAQIERPQGTRLAERYSSRSDYLGKVARSIVAGNDRPFERTYWEALRGVHN